MPGQAQFPYSLDELDRYFQASVRNAGRDLAARDAVLEWSVNSGANQVTLHGAVESARDEPWLVEVVGRESEGKRSFESHCTCAAIQWCKHTAALLAVAGRTATVRERQAQEVGPRPRPQAVAELRVRRQDLHEKLCALRLGFDYSALGETREPDLEFERQAVARLRKIGLTPIRSARYSAVDASEQRDDDWVFDTWQASDQVSLFLHLAEQLLEFGFRIAADSGFPIRIDAEPAAFYTRVDETAGNAWFDFDLGIEIDGERVSLLPILLKALDSPNFPLKPSAQETEHTVWLAPIDEHRRVALPVRRLRALLAPVLELAMDSELDEAGHLRLPRARQAALLLLDQLAQSQRLLGHEHLHAIAQRYTELKPPQPPQLPVYFTAALRPYQARGLEWLSALYGYQLGGILADDMGLGKTIQLLAQVSCQRAADPDMGPALVVTATSVLPNWRREAERFAPGLRVLTLQGPLRTRDFETLGEFDLVLTSYTLLVRDRDLHAEQRYGIIALDEAQAIKNPRSLAATVARTLNGRQRLCLTGTPVENHLGELWSLLDFAVPGLLGDEKSFTRLIRTPIEKHGDQDCQQRLNRRVQPFLLRRTKEQVARDLPPKLEIAEAIDIGGAQRDLYESLRLLQHQRIQQAISEQGIGRSGIVVLDALLKLRQACCDPRLLDLEAAQAVEESAKLSRLLDMLDELVAAGKHVLVFSQFTRMLDLIETELHERFIEFTRLDGSTRDRDAPVQAFQSGEVPVFLISLRAGGVGLNLTAADTVIHYDPWWNPAVEAQATDRAYRIGQDKPVFVYRLICTGTVEEKIQALQARKAALAAALLNDADSEGLVITPEDIAALFDSD
ncbi:MAG: DEAD/DEAH box helicase [Lysobacterales bacterium]